MSNRRIRTEISTYGSTTYVIQTDLSAGLGARYTVFRLDAYSKQALVIGRELPLRRARMQCPGHPTHEVNRDG
jgi:hypothetical protein